MKETRIEFRSSQKEKDLLMLAAQLIGINYSAFIRQAVIEAANQIVQEHETIRLSDRDRDLFLKALEAPQKPNKKLKEAMKRYKKEYEF